MITNYKDFIYYRQQDIMANKHFSKPQSRLDFYLKKLFFKDQILKFLCLLRQVEYYKNTKKGFFYKVVLFYKLFQFKKLSVKLGFSIPPNVFGPGLSIAHYGTIVVNSNCKIGANCRLNACVIIGASGGEIHAPILGDNLYIGPGAKIFGNIEISSNNAIGANAVVNNSILVSNSLIAGIPAKVVSKVDISLLIPNLKDHK